MPKLQYSFEVLDFSLSLHLHWLSFLPSIFSFITLRLSYWFPSSHTTLFFLLVLFSPHLPNDFVLFTLLLPIHFFGPHIFPLPPFNSLLLSNFLSPFFSSSLPFLSHLSDLDLPPPARAAVPGRAPPVQAAAGSWGRVFLRELPIRPAQPRLCSHWGGAPTWWWGQRGGLWEAALPNGRYVWRLWKRRFYLHSSLKIHYWLRLNNTNR